MRGLAALGAAAFIAAAGVFWFMSRPVIVTIKREPLKASAEFPTFKRLER